MKTENTTLFFFEHIVSYILYLATLLTGNAVEYFI